MEISLSIFLYIYLLLLIAYVLFALFNFYHLFKFSLNQTAGLMATIIFIFGAGTILFFTFIYIGETDWSKTIKIIDSFTNINNLPYVQ